MSAFHTRLVQKSSATAALSAFGATDVRGRLEKLRLPLALARRGAGRPRARGELRRGRARGRRLSPGPRASRGPRGRRGPRAAARRGAGAAAATARLGAGGGDARTARKCVPPEPSFDPHLDSTRPLPSSRPSRSAVVSAENDLVGSAEGSHRRAFGGRRSVCRDVRPEASTAGDRGSRASDGE